MLTEKVIRLEYNIQNDKKSACEIGNRPVTTAAVPRTCREARSGDPTLNSGMYWIDPDGQGVGDGPIYVYCDMNSGKTFFSAFDCNGEDDESINIEYHVSSPGSTSILHNSELPTNVGHCADPGCYSRSVVYNASSRQMTALAELSYECHQSIRVGFIISILLIRRERP